MEIQQKLIEAFTGLLNSSIALAPKIAVGIALLILGLLFTKLVEIGLRIVLRRISLDALVQSAGADKLLERIGIRQAPSVLLPRIAYFLTLFILAQTSAEALGLVAISSAIGTLFAYLPNLFAALLLIVVGSTLGQFAGETVEHSAAASGIDVAPALGRLVSSGIFFICAMMAVGQLQIDTAIVRIVTSILLGGAALAFGLSFGFGTREIVSNIAAGFYARKVLQIGRPLNLQGHSGTLVSITATHLILESEGRQIAVANASLLANASSQGPRL
jgi:hypothetical protein